MRFPQLIKGGRYILEAPQGQVAVYEGSHDGKLILADGSTFYGRSGMLRFSYTDEEGVKRTVLFENAGAAKEAEATKLERERLEQEQKLRRIEAHQGASTFLRDLGYEVLDGRKWDALKNPEQVSIDSPESYNSVDSVDEVEVEGLTIGKLKAMIKRGQPIAAR